MPGGLRVTRLVRIAMERIEHDGVGAEQMQLREVIDDLVDCSLTGEAPPGGDGFFGQPQGDTWHKAGDRSLVFVREHRYPVHRLTQPGHRDPKRMPAIAQAHRAAHARIAVAAHPYRYPPTAVVLVVLPGRAQRPQVVVGQLPRSRNGTPSASNSWTAQPTPTPRTRRPPLISLRLAAIRAVSSGCRYGTIKTVVPSRIVR